LQRLLVAYSLVTGGFLAKGRDEPPSSELPPAAFALIKLVLDHPRARDERIVALLRARDPDRALALALRRARQISALPGRPRSIAAAEIANPEWYAAAALIPIRRTARDYGTILDAALVRDRRGHIDQDARDYLNSLEPTSDTGEDE
ncbi:MAG: hypothetical protein ACREM8_01120, partial [Vulcanimicrobiaceae bacterium]